jgi:DnaK suppressor protein
MGGLNADEIEVLRLQLLELRADLEELLAVTREGARPVGLDEPIGRLSRMDEMQRQSMHVANRHAAKMRQQQVTAALVRIEEGEYGECVGCGEWITPRRLEAAPEAPFCITCQSSRERRS